MNNSQFMNVFNSTDNLLEYLTGLIFIHPLLIYNIIKKLSSLHVLHHQKQMLRRFNNLIELNDIGMPYQFEDMDFP